MENGSHPVAILLNIFPFCSRRYPVVGKCKHKGYCEASSFNNVNNYIRDFKKLVGTTPFKYRNYWIK